MKENIFRTDSTQSEKKEFLKRIGAVFSLSIILTGIAGIAGAVSLIGTAVDGVDQLCSAKAAWQILYTAVILLVFVSLIKIAIDEKPFSQTLTWTIRLIGIFFIAASVVIPRLSGYQSSGFEFFSSGSFVLIDLGVLLPGFLFVILANIIKAGFDMQREMDEIL